VRKQELRFGHDLISYILLLDVLRFSCGYLVSFATLPAMFVKKFKKIAYLFTVIASSLQGEMTNKTYIVIFIHFTVKVAEQTA